MAVSIQVLAKNLFNALLSFKQQNALRGLVTARCTVLALRSKQVKFLHFLFLPWASIGRRLTPELWARVIIADLDRVLMPCSEASEMGSWASVGTHLACVLGSSLPHCFLSLQKWNPEATYSSRKGHRSSSFGAREIPLIQSVPFLLLRLT